MEKGTDGFPEQKRRKVNVNQTVIQGENSIREISSAIIGAGHHSVFLITGRHFPVEEYTGLFHGLTITHFVKSGTNVEEEEAEQGFNNFLESGAQPIVAIGGGSVMDFAKTIIYRCTESSLAIPFFAAVPTTAGSGSEATHFAVVYRKKKKISLVHQDLLPKLVILDPVLTYSLSPYQTAVTGMDAFSQAVESYWNVHAVAKSKDYAATSIGFWKESFLSAVNIPAPESRKKMQQAAYLSGKAINITRTTGPHALSYYLTIQQGIPHGQAVAIFLPVFFLYNNPGIELLSLLGANDAHHAKEMIQQIMKKTGLAIRLSELGLDKKNIINAMLDEVNEERFANNPVALDREKLKQLIEEHL